MNKRLIAAMLFMMAACALASQSGCTPTRSAADNSRRQARLLKREMLMLVEDVNHFLLLDHPTRLNTWHYKQ